MKKMIVTTAAAAAILAAPFAGKADAAEIKPIQTKVVYYQIDASKLSNDWYETVLKQLNINLKDAVNWNTKYQLAPEKQEVQTQKPVQQQPVQKPVEKPVPAPTPTEKPAPTQPVEQQAQKPASPQPTEQKPAEQTNSQLSAFEQQVFELTNQERAKNGLAPLKIDLELSKVAREKSRDMSVNKYFDHNSPTYGSPFDMMKKFGITYRSAGENIAMGQRTPEEVVNAWMNSSGHRANILSTNFTHIGIGYVANGNYWTQQFIGK
ncbi:CAP domain-containing protein [Bacillus sp. FJAT-50079]|uniref:CAP domain-containing protein n=1 Tax=Bacillus sp. FJAT-50079 TaxID=2833577 RepID=UPI001BC8DBD6|nr:CAP domain-containing protein [Bacillus sp. FJAT-50079]MBS4209852.1 sporulation protein [Bacillus sp. FJAT-50079]